MCNCHSILECCVMFSGVKLSIISFNLFKCDTYITRLPILSKMVQILDIPVYCLVLHNFPTKKLIVGLKYSKES